MERFIFSLIISAIGQVAFADYSGLERRTYKCGRYFIQVANQEFAVSYANGSGTIASSINGEMTLGLPDYQRLRSGGWVKTFDYSKAYVQSENEFRFVIKEVMQFYDDELTAVLRFKEVGTHMTLEIEEGDEATLFEQPFKVEDGSKVYDLAPGLPCT